MERHRRWVVSLFAVVVSLLSALVLWGNRAHALVLGPVPGAVLAEFDPPEPDWLPGHRGLDLAAAPGQPVISPRAGVVAFVGTVAGMAVVVVAHGPVRATYQPVTSTAVPGTPVGAGDVIGTVADSAVADSGFHCATGCLHWGAKLGERYIDPRLLIGPVTVVLRPVPQ